MKSKLNRVTVMRKLCALIVVAVMCIGALSGCMVVKSLTSISFTKSSISLKVGETSNLSGLVAFSPSTATNKNYQLVSSNLSVVTVSGTSITAVSAGSAAITAVADENSKITARIDVKVDYEELSEVGITYTGSLLQIYDTAAPNGNLSSVIFRLNINENVDPTVYENIEWLVNDKSQNVDESKFSYTPQSTGKYVVYARTKVKGGEYFTSNTVTIQVYNDSVKGTVAVEDESLLEQESRLMPVKFSVTLDNEDENMLSTVIFKVNGEVAQSSTSKTFTFTPQNGNQEYVITVFLNSDTNQLSFNDGEKSKTVKVVGLVSFTNLRLEFDNSYPNVYIKWDNISIDMTYTVTVTAPNGTSSIVYSSDNAAHADRFTSNSFNLGGSKLVENFTFVSSNSTVKQYSVSIKALDSESIVRGSADYTFKQITKTQGSYWSNTVFGGTVDHYITSFNDYVKLIDYYVNWRNQSKSYYDVSEDNAITVKTLIAYDLESKYKADNKIIEAALYAVPLTLMFGYSSKINASNVCSSNFYTLSQNVPTMNSADLYGAQQYTEDGLKVVNTTAIMPHINYRGTDDGYTDRANTFNKFPIDSRTQTIKVKDSEQLFYAAENGFKPEPVDNSRVSGMYDYARKVLRQIISDDMDDAEKAHAIHDWVIWRVTYDYNSTYTNTGNDPDRDFIDSLKAQTYSLEGVLTDGSTRYSGDNFAFSPYAVCDGISKAVSLLCNIEGLPCKRTGVSAGSSEQSAGGHVWNRVYIENSENYEDGWYLIDCTWAQTGYDGSSKTGSGVYIFGSSYSDTYFTVNSHQYLLRSDSGLSATHFYSDYQKQTEHEADVAENFAYFKYNYADTAKKYNYYITLAEVNNKTALKAKLTAILQAQLADKRVTFEVPGDAQAVTSRPFSLSEIVFEVTTQAMVTTVTDTIVDILKGYGFSLNAAAVRDCFISTAPLEYETSSRTQVYISNVFMNMQKVQQHTAA